jgi:DNA polymerase II large subunit
MEKEKLKLELNENTKKTLEKIGLEHYLENDKIVIQGEQAQACKKVFGFDNPQAESLVSENILDSLSQISGVTIKDKGGTFIGARMGRPEAAKEREMKGHPHVLFPVGWFGGNTRSINKAVIAMEEKHRKGLDLEISSFKCPKCEKIMAFPYCPDCQTRTHLVFTCKSCGRVGNQEKCAACGAPAHAYSLRKIPLDSLLLDASAKLKVRIPDPVKGVKGMISGQKIPEPLEKGILRAKHDVHVFRDGTSRFELLNAPLTHFKPKELKLSVEKAKALGYTTDINNQPLKNDEQLIELFPQDIVINDKGGDWMLRMSKFIDELLERFYGLPAYYQAQSKEDLIGEIVVGLAPHTSAGIVGRVIGYSSSRLGWGHPYFFMATRRNFDGDQNSIMLLMDSLLNFSQSYLADKSGGRMDTPLVFTIALNPLEIDDEVYEMETVTQYPLDLYEKSQEFIAPFMGGVALVENKLGSTEQYSGLNFTHSTSCFDAGPKQSMYTQLQSMEEKIRRQADLQNRIRAVDGKDALERVLRSHFFPDIIGNAHSFSKQKFRCTKCNSKYRRLPLKGSCLKCGNQLILTIAEGSVRKYLEIAKQMIHEYGLSNYLKQRIELTEQEVESIFKSDNVQQKNLFEFV